MYYDDDTVGVLLQGVIGLISFIFIKCFIIVWLKNSEIEDGYTCTCSRWFIAIFTITIGYWDREREREEMDEDD